MENTEELFIEIPKKRAEIPALIVMGFVVFAGWALHYGIFNVVGGLLWLLVALPVYFWIYKKRSGQYFVRVNKDGIGFRQHFFSNYVYVPWNYLQRIDYLVFEINFMVKESAQVVCFPTSGLDDDQVDNLKLFISKMVEIQPIKE